MDSVASLYCPSFLLYGGFLSNKATHKFRRIRVEPAIELDGWYNWNMGFSSYLEIDIVIGVGDIVDEKERG